MRNDVRLLAGIACVVTTVAGACGGDSSEGGGTTGAEQQAPWTCFIIEADYHFCACEHYPPENITNEIIDSCSLEGGPGHCCASPAETVECKCYALGEPCGEGLTEVADCSEPAN